MRASGRITISLVTVMLVFASGCGSMGPPTVQRDQINYGTSISETWKIQMLANLVKLRFIDMPVFVDVGQIVAGYSLETQVSGSLGFGTSFTGEDAQSLGANGRFTDRPTITYMPKTGEHYLRSLLEPIDPAALLSLTAAGYDPRLLFTWAVESINGVRNFSGAGKDARLPDERYYEFVDLLTMMQQNGAVGFELQEDPETGHAIVFFFSSRNLPDEVRAKRERIRNMLGLSPGQNQFRVVYSPFAVEGNVLAIQTRSPIQILSAMSGFIDVPSDKTQRAAPGFTLPPGIARPFTVRTSTERPEDAYASFHYEDDWYWIDHEDLTSKRVFTMMLFLTTLTSRAGPENAPVLTIPTN